MKLHRLQLLSGAVKATGLAVIIDVFRAFTVVCYLFEGNVTRIYPVSRVEDAFRLKQLYPQALMIGERDGYKLEGFDFGNSPSEIMQASALSSVIIHTTSAGTQGLSRATRAHTVLCGSLVNAKAIVHYINRIQPEEVSLVAMGKSGSAPADEDDLCATYIEALLQKKMVNEEKIIQRLYYGAGRKFFSRDNGERYPQSDFHWCTLFNRFNFIVRQKVDQNALPYLVKENIVS